MLLITRYYTWFYISLFNGPSSHSTVCVCVCVCISRYLNVIFYFAFDRVTHVLPNHCFRMAEKNVYYYYIWRVFVE